MICPEKPLTQQQSLRTRESNLEQKQPKPKLAARWQKMPDLSQVKNSRSIRQERIVNLSTGLERLSKPALILTN